ncbi:MAG TPA: peptide ABC transporter substrate-binding protein [Firmicutes bacterium]|jgi:peptide/nickel transport system substrate-binding protein|nr:ABC transporter substrate-binding protein [Bacillota bacterium]HAN86016.1 peptide ABC transporter substrate-binding protein [Bacillota bacterium]
MKMRTALIIIAIAIFASLGFAPAALGTTKGQLSVIIDTESIRADEAQAIAHNLRAIGVSADVRIWEWSALKERIQAGERQIYLTDWGSAYFDPFDIVVPKFRTGDRGNYSGYSNPQFDAALDRALLAVDADVRRDAYFDAQQILFEDVPALFGYSLMETEAARADVLNWQPSMDSRVNLHDVGLSRGDTILVGLYADKIVTLDPAAYRDRPTETVIRNMFDALVTRTWDGRVVPEIAEAWKAESDTEYLFRIRKGIKFHNGDSLDADDVVYTFDRVLKEGGMGGRTSPRQGLLGPVEKVEKVDAYTVRFVLSAPFPVLPQALVHIQIVPRDYMERVGDEAFSRQPIGCGPFRYVEGRLDDKIVMERFDGYYGGSPMLPPVGTARVKRAIFRMMPDPTVRVAALKTGEVHIIQAVPAHVAASLMRDRNIQVRSVEGTRVYFAEMNCTRPPFDDLRVRRAINYAVDWDTILRTIYAGNATRLSTAFLPSGFGFNPKLAPYGYDPARARSLLAEAGYLTR